MPPPESYGCDTMMPTERGKFFHWYNTQVRSGYVFCMPTEIVKYCISDVDILRKGCIKFRKCFIESNNVDPFLECLTIPSACSLAYRRNFLKHDTVGIAPKNGYRRADNQSVIGIQWLSWMSHSEKIKINHAGVGRETVLQDLNITVDGYCKDNNTVYEFYGCWWHGCERCFFNQTAVLSEEQDKLFLRRECSKMREERIKNAGYNFVSIWECDFRRLIKNNVEVKEFTKNIDALKVTPLNPRDSFFGGRTNACKLYHKVAQNEKIMYFDVCSLYPYVNKYGKYPVGHPKIHIGEECKTLDLKTVEGLVKCKVLPPRNLYHPVLPYKSNGKLTFPLCRSCVEKSMQGKCPHKESKDRQFVGTFVADELRKAMSLKYKVVEVLEIWEYAVIQFNKTTGVKGLFTDYVNTFLKIKQECSGWPSWCQTETDKIRYINEYESREGIRLEKDKVSLNPGMRFVAKSQLNCLWGKFGQRENPQKTEIIDKPLELFQLLTNPSVLVTAITVISQESLLVTWQRTDEDEQPLKTVNVPIAAYTTALARLELYKYLEKLGRRVLYFDTDSIIFVHREGEWLPPVGDFLGDLTDEIAEYGPGAHIVEFVSGGPKNYAFKIWIPCKNEFKTICKVKGITLNYKNSNLINFDVLRDLICNDFDREIRIVDKKITRDSRCEVTTAEQPKTYRINISKRWRSPNTYDTLPYGFTDEMF